MNDVATDTALFTDDDLATINQARDLLDRIAAESARLSMDAPSFDGANANAGDYARVSALAEVAASSLFDLLNVTSAHNVQKIADSIMHRRYES